MQLEVKVRVSEKLFLKDPEQSELGRKIVARGVALIESMGFEQFTFKKLATDIGTTEAGIYRYFENKHRLLLYLISWHWNYLEFLVFFSLQNLSDPVEKIRRAIELIAAPLPDDHPSAGTGMMDKKALFEIVVAESNKAYLTKDVAENNRDQLFKPYKDLCARIARLISDYNPDYPHSRSLSSTLVETAHFQHFFMEHLPRLTDFEGKNDPALVKKFLEHLVFSAIKK